ncbi:MAG TPA: MFS transporter [Sphingomicrobium sp.]|nr:MFS transporter [Sphingomicrobium sp.]
MATAVRSTRTPVTGFVVIVAAAIFLNYVDRGAIGIGAPLMKSDLGLSATQFGLAISAFFWVYAPIQLLIGRLCDRLPVYRVYGAGIALWAASTFLTGLVAGITSLVILRVVLGIGESVAFPASSKMIARHVPAERRGMANAAVGAALAFGPAAGTLAGGLITAFYGWRAMFLAFGALTFLWLAPWFAIVRTIRQESPSAPDDWVPTRKVTRHFALWAMGIGHITNTYGFYFLLAWLPLFLVQSRGYSIQQMSYAASLSYAAQGAAALTLGWLSDTWTGRGRSEGGIRRGMLVACHVLLAASIIGILVSHSLGAIEVWLLLAGIANGAGALNMYAIAQMFAGERAAGTWVGVQNGVGNLSGVVGPVATGVIIDFSGSYAGGFWLAAAVAAFGAIWWGLVLPKIEPVKFD